MQMLRPGLLQLMTGSDRTPRTVARKLKNTTGFNDVNRTCLIFVLTMRDFYAAAESLFLLLL